MSKLRPTYVHPARARYRRPGGPWDPAAPLLDELLRGDASFEASVASTAGGLRAAGVRRGDVVAWQLPNKNEAVVLFRACWRIGAVAAPLHPAAGAAEVDAQLAVLGPSLVIDVGGAIPAGDPVSARTARPHDLAVVLFTSGSSGAPKAVLHTQRGLAWKARLMARVHGLTADDAILMPAPLAHISGLLNAVLVPGAAGMRVVLMERWDPEHALRIIEDERITFMIGPPTFFVGLMDAAAFSRERVASLRLVSSGGSSVTPAFVERAADSLGCMVKRTYGSTEAPTITTSHAGDPPERGRDTDGRPTGEVELRIEQTGELLVRGPELFAGYADPAQTTEAVHRGWFRTGDRAVIDDDGWLRVVGRIKDIVIRGGENISVSEVEAVLEAHPDVRQAVAIGYPDDVMGERVAAFVVASAPFDLDACRNWFIERGVARFKTPERVIQLEAMPTMTAGKPDRTALQRRL